MKTCKTPNTSTKKTSVSSVQEAEQAGRTCLEALGNDLVRGLVIKDMNMASLLMVGSVDAAFASTVKDKRIEQAIILAQDMSYLYILRNVKGIVKQLCFCRPLECESLQLFGMTALHHLMLRPHDQPPLRDDDIWECDSVIFIEQRGVEMMLESTKMHRTCVPLQMICCRIMLSLLRLWRYRDMIIPALRSFIHVGGVDIVIAAMASYPKKIELQHEGQLLVGRLLEYRDDISTQWSHLQMRLIVALTLQNLQEYTYSREINTSGMELLSRALVNRSKMSQWTPGRSYSCPKAGSNAALAQLMATESLQIIIDASKRIAQEESDDRYEDTDIFADVVLPFYETTTGVQQIIQSGCVAYILFKLDTLDDLDTKRQMLYILLQWSSNPQLGIEIVNNNVPRRCVHWACTLANDSMVQDYVCEIIRNLSSNTAWIENVVAAGAVSLLVINIENATMSRSHIVPLICEALRNIAVFEVSLPRDERWIQDGDGLSAIEKIKWGGTMGFVVSDKTHVDLKQAREFCDMAVEALWRIPFYRKNMQARRLIPCTSQTSIFSRAFSVLGL